jgi:hypothetical protein
MPSMSSGTSTSQQQQQQQQRMPSSLRLRRPVAPLTAMRAAAAQTAPPRPTQLAAVVSERVGRHVIMLIVALQLVLPLFDAFVFLNPHDGHDRFAMAELHRRAFAATASGSTPQQQVLLRDAVRRYAQQPGVLLHLTLHGVPGPTMHAMLTGAQGFNDALYLPQSHSLSALYRDSEMNVVRVLGCFTPQGELIATDDRCASVAVWSLRDRERLDAWLHIGQTLFVIAVLILSAVVFTSDIDVLLRPIGCIADILGRVARHEPSLPPPMLTSKDLELNGIENALLSSLALLQAATGPASGDMLALAASTSLAQPTSIHTTPRRVTGVFGVFAVADYARAARALHTDVFSSLRAVTMAVHNAVRWSGGVPYAAVGGRVFAAWLVDDDVDSGGGGGDVRDRDGDSDGGVRRRLHARNRVAATAFAASVRCVMEALLRQRDGAAIAAAEGSSDDPAVAQPRITVALHSGWAMQGECWWSVCRCCYWVAVALSVSVSVSVPSSST